MNKCKCGCGGECKQGNVYIYHHNTLGMVGKHPWNYQKKGCYSELTIQAMKEGHIGKSSNNKGKKNPPHTKEWKECLSKMNTGKGNPFYNKHHTEKTKQINREKHSGINSSNWQGGKSFEPYGLEFNSELREQIRKRDNYRCQECFREQSELRTLKTNRKYKLIVHHIDYNKKNNSSNNLISLCLPCHMQTNFEREDWTNYLSGRVIK